MPRGRPACALPLLCLICVYLCSSVANLSERARPMSDDFESLEPGARAGLATAHGLAQECGVRRSRPRLLLAAFLADPAGCAARAVRGAGVKPRALFEVLLAASRGPGPRRFPLAEACGPVVLPVLAEARQAAGA